MIIIYHENTISQAARSTLRIDRDHGYTDIPDARRHSRQLVDLARQTGQHSGIAATHSVSEVGNAKNMKFQFICLGGFICP